MNINTITYISLVMAGAETPSRASSRAEKPFLAAWLAVFARRAYASEIPEEYLSKCV
jgi:hypothetical protein